MQLFYSKISNLFQKSTPNELRHNNSLATIPQLFYFHCSCVFFYGRSCKIKWPLPSPSPSSALRNFESHSRLSRKFRFLLSFHFLSIGSIFFSFRQVSKSIISLYLPGIVELTLSSLIHHYWITKWIELK